MKSNHSAGPMISGVTLQFERALHHLSLAGDGEAVSVEQVDDVARSKGGRTLVQEQDKKSVVRRNAVLGDRNLGLWRTLQIWVQGIQENGRPSLSYLLVTNASPRGTVVDALRRPVNEPGRPATIVAMLKAAGALRRAGGQDTGGPSRIQQAIDDVLSADEDLLLDLASRIELVENFDATSERPQVAARLGMHPDTDRDFIIDATLGWIVDQLKKAWDSGAAGVISKDDCLRYIRGKESRVERRRWMPRSGRLVPIDQEQVARAKGRTFVDQLEWIAAREDELLEAVEHWVQFNTEKSRLVQSGDIDDEVWEDRGESLRQRWVNFERLAERTQQHLTPQDRGYRVYAETTFQHREPIDGEPCSEHYMTAGHYHRLADEKQVCWHSGYGKD